MRSISILNFKGGTGKSTVVENLGYALAKAGERILVIDADRQGNSSTTLLGGEMAPTLSDVLQGRAKMEHAIKAARENLWVIPAGGDLDEASPYLSAHPETFSRLERAVGRLTDFDYLLFDHAGAYTVVMASALVASTEMMIPCELEAYSVRGLTDMLNKLQEKLPDHEIRNAGIIPYNVDLRYTMARQYLKDLREAFGDLITAPVRTDSLVPKAQSLRMTVLEYEATYGLKSRAAEDFRTLAVDLIEEVEEANR